jgi:hypothetical protein
MALKRIRLLATSKSGCFTCKYVKIRKSYRAALTQIIRLRRVKCDEGKPTCARCARSGKSCSGYPGRESPDASAVEISYLARGLTATCIRNEHHRRSVDHGLQIVLADSFHTFGACRNVYQSLVPQLCFSVLPVSAVVAAIGSAWILEASSIVDFEKPKS